MRFEDKMREGVDRLFTKIGEVGEPVVEKVKETLNQTKFRVEIGGLERKRLRRFGALGQRIFELARGKKDSKILSDSEVVYYLDEIETLNKKIEKIRSSLGG